MQAPQNALHKLHQLKMAALGTFVLGGGIACGPGDAHAFSDMIDEGPNVSSNIRGSNAALTTASFSKGSSRATYEITTDSDYFSHDYLPKQTGDFGVSDEVRVKLEKNVSIYVINSRNLMPAAGHTLSSYAKEIQNCLDMSLSYARERGELTSPVNPYLYRYLYKFGAAYVPAKNLHHDLSTAQSSDRPHGPDHGPGSYKGAYSPNEYAAGARGAGVCKDFANFFVKLINTAGKEIQYNGQPLGLRAEFQCCFYRPLYIFNPASYDPKHNPGQHAFAWVKIPVGNTYDCQPQDVTLGWGHNDDIDPKTYAIQAEASAKIKQSPITALERELWCAQYAALIDDNRYEGSRQNLIPDTGRNLKASRNSDAPYDYANDTWLEQAAIPGSAVQEHLLNLKNAESAYHRACTRRATQ